MSFPRYPAYKDSGVEWLGEVPAHWDVRPLKHLVSLRSGGTPSKEKRAYWDGDVPWASSKDLKTETLSDTQDHITQHAVDEGAAELVPVGSLLIVVRGMILAHTFPVTKLLVPMAINQDLRALTSRGALGVEFLSWLLRGSSRETLDRVDEAGHGTKVLRIEAWTSLPLPVPVESEQALIVRFLEQETAKIDALVDEQRRLIALLKEKRQAVISHAVTRGLNPDAPMKETGVERFGALPAHWSVVPIRYVARLESGHTPSRLHPEYWDCCKYPWFSLGDVWQIREAKRDVIYETQELVSDLGLANSAARMLPKGTVMLSRTASVGFSAIMGVDMATTQDFANWICGPRLLPEFLLQVFRSMTGEFRKLMYGSTHNTIYMPDIMAFRMALPPLDEQAAIVRDLATSLAKLDTLSAEAERAIALLQERRTALISAAVTGQIDVRGAIV